MKRRWQESSVNNSKAASRSVTKTQERLTRGRRSATRSSAAEREEPNTDGREGPDGLSLIPNPQSDLGIMWNRTL